MGKFLTGFCPTCDRRTKHKIIHCTESIGWRIFENIFTFGMIAAVCGYEYNCECTKCGSINTLHN